MTAYADLTYYKNTFLGTAIADAAFPALALKASALLDQMTFDRAASIVTAGTDTATIDKIQMATCEVAERLQAIGGTIYTADAVQSESLGGASVTYAKGSSQTMTNLDKLSQSARLYLGNTGLMFRGFADGEYSGDLEDDDE